VDHPDAGGAGLDVFIAQARGGEAAAVGTAAAARFASGHSAGCGEQCCAILHRAARAPRPAWRTKRSCRCRKIR
jgi:hypothetical protein